MSEQPVPVRRSPRHETLYQQQRRVAGQVDKSLMSAGEREASGLMTLAQATEHERLAALPGPRLADRSHGPDPDDIWALPDGGAIEAGGETDAD